MKVKLATRAGFCMGVRRAMEIVLTEVNKGATPIYTFGPLIHNKQVLELLESKGVFSIRDINGLKEGTLVIRAHGIPPDQRKRLRASGLKLIDATCPRVARVQSIIRYYSHKGFTAVIVGDREHAEVIGLVGYGNGRSHVINHVDEVSRLPNMEKLFIVAQTTQDIYKFKAIVEAIKQRHPEALVFDTICDATHNRQDEVRSFAGHVDGVVVVGGYHSGNTQRLVQVAEAVGLPTLHVETEEEIEREWLSSMEVVGVTAGASTPNWMIRNVVKEIEAIRSRKETTLGRLVKNAIKMLFLSNVVVGLGAFCLTYASIILTGRKTEMVHPTIAFLYIYAMYVLNRFLDKGASTYNDPERAQFYRKHRLLLTVAGVVSIVGALALSLLMGKTIFFTMILLIILGSIYSIPIVPTSRRHLWRYTKIKDIPGSRTLSEALAWGVVIALLPLLKDNGAELTAMVISFLFVFSTVYVRSAVFDIFQIQGDRIVGVETLPITLGEERTLRLLKSVTLAAALIFLAATVVGLVTPLGYLLLICFFWLIVSLYIYSKRWLYPGTRLEAILEGNFFFAGLISLIWNLFAP